MDSEALSRLAGEIARSVIEAGRVEGDGEWWLASLGLEVLLEAEARGYENSTEISEAAVRQYTKT